MVAPKWATVEDVKALTDRDVTAATLNMAKTVIEIKSGLIESVERTDMAPRDRYWLKLASIYQAVWMEPQIDVLERMAPTSLGQDGQSITVANPEDWELAPLAKSSLKRLSWKGTRTVAPRPADAGGAVSFLISDDHDFTAL